MHAIQTSGNCIRNVTSRPFRRRRRRRGRRPAAVGRDAAAVVDAAPRVQLPAAQVQDRGHRRAGRPRGGRGRTTSACILKRERGGRDRLRGHGRRRPRPHADDRQDGPRVPAGGRAARLLEAILRVYNRYGRRDNKYKARIKILVHELGARGVHARGRGRVRGRRPRRGHRRSPPTSSTASRPTSRRRPSRRCPTAIRCTTSAPARSATSRAGCDTTRRAHKVPGYAIVNVSLKPIGGIAGRRHRRADGRRRRPRRRVRLRRDPRHATSRTWCCRTSASATCPRSGTLLDEAGLATANSGLITDIIACPGLDYCALATARSIPIAQAIAERFADARAPARRSAS